MATPPVAIPRRGSGSAVPSGDALPPRPRQPAMVGVGTRNSPTK